MSYKRSSKITPSELVLSTIFSLQKKGGITATDITKLICENRGCKQSHIRHEVKKALEKATESGIFSKKRGLYKIEGGFEKGKILVSTNRKNIPKKVKKKGTTAVAMDTVNVEEYNNECISDLPERRKCESDKNMGNPTAFSFSEGKRVSVERIKQTIMEQEDDDDEDFFEDEEAEEDEDMDFFSDEESMKSLDFVNHECDFTDEEKKDPELDTKKFENEKLDNKKFDRAKFYNKKASKSVKKNAKCKNKSKSKNKLKKRKASKPRKKASKRKRTNRSKKSGKAFESLMSVDHNQQDNKGNKENNQIIKEDEKRGKTNNCKQNIFDELIEMNEEEDVVEQESNSLLSGKAGEDYGSDLSPSEEILLDKLISGDDESLLEKDKNSQDLEKSNADGSASEISVNA